MFKPLFIFTGGQIVWWDAPKSREFLIPEIDHFRIVPTNIASNTLKWFRLVKYSMDCICQYLPPKPLSFFIDKICNQIGAIIGFPSSPKFFSTKNFLKLSQWETLNIPFFDSENFFVQKLTLIASTKFEPFGYVSFNNAWHFSIVSRIYSSCEIAKDVVTLKWERSREVLESTTSFHYIFHIKM